MLRFGDIPDPVPGGSEFAGRVASTDIQAGQQVLVYGATGAIGSAAVQIIKAIGAEVTAVCNTNNLDLVTSLGADRVIVRFRTGTIIV